MAENAPPQEPPAGCSACRGSGRISSNLGGLAHLVSCPWCDGTGQWLADHDAQAHWREGVAPPAPEV
jgi:DnaJ-class molecular chaperone